VQECWTLERLIGESLLVCLDLERHPIVSPPHCQIYFALESLPVNNHRGINLLDQTMDSRQIHHIHLPDTRWIGASKTSADDYRKSRITDTPFHSASSKHFRIARPRKPAISMGEMMGV
jgi:hypothetical protein